MKTGVLIVIEFIESASTDRREGGVPSSVRTAVSLVCNGAVAAVVVALLIGTTAGPPADSLQTSTNVVQPVRVDGFGSHYRIATRIPAGAGTVHLQVLAPDGKECVNLMFDKQNKLSYLHTARECPLSLGSAIDPSGGQVVNYRAQKSEVSIQSLPSGQLGVVVRTRQDGSVPLSEVWISPEGSVQSARHSSD